MKDIDTTYSSFKSRFYVYNPAHKEESELPTIFGFNNGGSDKFLTGVLLAEDGTCLGSHICSSEYFMYSDLGIIEGTRHDRHDEFKKHYPTGYKMEFVPANKVRTHKPLLAAYEKNQEKERREKEKRK